MSEKTCWVVTEGKAGMENQALGLAEAIGYPVSVKRLNVRQPWRSLPSALWFRPFSALASSGDTLEPPWPDLLIGCGRLSIPLSIAVRRASGGNTYTVQMQHPRVAFSNFDLVVPPRHDHASGDNVIETKGAVHRVTAERLSEEADKFSETLTHLPRPLVAVLVGGNSKVHKLTADTTYTLGANLKKIVVHGAGLAVTASRRTGVDNERILREMLDRKKALMWDGSGDNPYFGYLGLADAIIVTSDSVSMVSEAASTGKPVYVAELEGGSRKFDEFHALMRADGHTRPFTGELEDWTPPRLDDTERVAAEVLRRLAERD